MMGVVHVEALDSVPILQAADPALLEGISHPMLLNPKPIALGKLHPALLDVAAVVSVIAGAKPGVLLDETL
jgi:hypothetical protein